MSNSLLLKFIFDIKNLILSGKLAYPYRSGNVYNPKDLLDKICYDKSSLLDKKVNNLEKSDYIASLKNEIVRLQLNLLSEIDLLSDNLFKRRYCQIAINQLNEFQEELKKGFDKEVRFNNIELLENENPMLIIALEHEEYEKLYKLVIKHGILPLLTILKDELESVIELKLVTNKKLPDKSPDLLFNQFNCTYRLKAIIFNYFLDFKIVEGFKPAEIETQYGAKFKQAIYTVNNPKGKTYRPIKKAELDEIYPLLSKYPAVQKAIVNDLDKHNYPDV